METIRIILEIVLGSSTLLGFILYGKATRRTKNAEAEKTEAEAVQTEVDRLLGQVDHQQGTIEKLTTINDSFAERLGQLNSYLDKYIDRNRELSDRVYKSETEINRVNNLLTEVQHKNASLEHELGETNRLVDHYKLWRCERTDCQDPRGPKPPRDKLKNVKYAPPQSA